MDLNRIPKLVSEVEAAIAPFAAAGGWIEGVRALAADEPGENLSSTKAAKMRVAREQQAGLEAAVKHQLARESQPYDPDTDITSSFVTTELTPLQLPRVMPGPIRRLAAHEVTSLDGNSEAIDALLRPVLAEGAKKWVRPAGHLRRTKIYCSADSWRRSVTHRHMPWQDARERWPRIDTTRVLLGVFVAKRAEQITPWWRFDSPLGENDPHAWFVEGGRRVNVVVVRRFLDNPTTLGSLIRAICLERKEDVELH